jgi:hypothetical protein
MKLETFTCDVVLFKKDINLVNTCPSGILVVS